MNDLEKNEERIRKGQNLELLEIHKLFFDGFTFLELC